MRPCELLAQNPTKANCTETLIFGLFVHLALPNSNLSIQKLLTDFSGEYINIGIHLKLLINLKSDFMLLSHLENEINLRVWQRSQVDTP